MSANTTSPVGSSRFFAIAHRTSAIEADLRVEAQKAGAKVASSTDRHAVIFDDVQGAPYMRLGWIIWRKDLRGWEFLVRIGVRADGVAALIDHGIGVVMDSGPTPRLRNRTWNHDVTERRGRHAWQAVAMPVTDPGMLAALSVSAPDSIADFKELFASGAAPWSSEVDR